MCNVESQELILIIESGIETPVFASDKNMKASGNYW